MLEEDQVLCTKKGLRSAEKPCRKFKYDPCKRIPAKPKAMDFGKYDEEDFSLWFRFPYLFFVLFINIHPGFSEFGVISLSNIEK